MRVDTLGTAKQGMRLGVGLWHPGSFESSSILRQSPNASLRPRLPAKAVHDGVPPCIFDGPRFNERERTLSPLALQPHTATSPCQFCLLLSLSVSTDPIRSRFEQEIWTLTLSILANQEMHAMRLSLRVTVSISSMSTGARPLAEVQLPTEPIENGAKDEERNH